MGWKDWSYGMRYPLQVAVITLSLLIIDVILLLYGEDYFGFRWINEGEGQVAGLLVVLGILLFSFLIVGSVIARTIGVLKDRGIPLTLKNFFFPPVNKK